MYNVFVCTIFTVTLRVHSSVLKCIVHYFDYEWYEVSSRRFKSVDILNPANCIHQKKRNVHNKSASRLTCGEHTCERRSMKLTFHAEWHSIQENSGYLPTGFSTTSPFSFLSIYVALKCGSRLSPNVNEKNQYYHSNPTPIDKIATMFQ